MSCLISIVIPVYNAGKYLEECLESVVAYQDCGAFEVILVDDGSRDESGKICDAYSEKYGNIHTFHIKNSGVSNARNYGIEHSVGEYITFCDADDYYINDLLSEASAVLKRESPDLLFYNYIYEQADGVKTQSYHFEKDSLLYDPVTLLKYMLKSEAFNSSCNKFFKRDIIRENNISFKAGQRYGEDRDFVMKYLTVSQSSYYLPLEGYFYRYVKSSAVNKTRYDYFDNVFYEYRSKKGICEELGILNDETLRALTETAVNHTVTAVFASYNNGFYTYMRSVKTLFKNSELMDVLSKAQKIIFYNYAHSEVYQYIIRKQAVLCWLYVKKMHLKEKLYRIINKRGKV